MFSEISQEFLRGRGKGGTVSALSLCVAIIVSLIVISLLDLSMVLVHSRCSVNYWMNESMIITSMNVCCMPGTILNNSISNAYVSHLFYFIFFFMFPILIVRKLGQNCLIMCQGHHAGIPTQAVWFPNPCLNCCGHTPQGLITHSTGVIMGAITYKPGSDGSGQS